MNYSIIKIGEKIRELRTNAGLSQDGLIKKLNEEYHFEIARKTLSRIENGEEISEKSISLPLLSALADLFDCQIGYILGEIECKTRSKQTIQDVTGLSPKSCDELIKLCSYNEDFDFIEAMNFLLQHEEFKFLIHDLCNYGYNYIDKSKSSTRISFFRKTYSTSNSPEILKFIVSDRFSRIVDDFHKIHDSELELKRYEEDLEHLFHVLELYEYEITQPPKIAQYIDKMGWLADTDIELEKIISQQLERDADMLHKKELDIKSTYDNLKSRIEIVYDNLKSKYPEYKFFNVGIDYILNNATEILDEAEKNKLYTRKIHSDN